MKSPVILITGASQGIGAAIEPIDVEGVSTLTKRYWDWESQDAIWAFVPSTRRARRVNAAVLVRPFLTKAIDSGMARVVGDWEAMEYPNLVSIARKAVRMHGGDIHVRNLPGKGCVFAIEVPQAGEEVGVPEGAVVG